MCKFKIGDKVRLTKSALEAWVASDFYTDGIKAVAIITAREIGIYINYRLLFPNHIYKDIETITKETGYIQEKNLELAYNCVTLWDI